MQLSKLERAFRFTHEELIINREGVLSQRQIARLLRHARNLNNARIVVSVCAAPILLDVLLNSPTHVHDASRILAYSITLIVMLWGSIVFMLTVSKRQIEETVDNNIVDAMQGTISLYKRRNSRHINASYYAYIGDTCFSITGKQYKALSDGAVYTVYYAGKYHRLLSIEPIPTQNLIVDVS